MRVILIRKLFYSLLSKEEFLCLFSYKSIHQTRIIKQTVFKENGFAYLIKNVRKSSLMHFIIMQESQLITHLSQYTVCNTHVLFFLYITRCIRGQRDVIKHYVVLGGLLT